MRGGKKINIKPVNISSEEAKNTEIKSALK